MKVYTKTGDKGTTALVGGRRVPKNHKRIEAYGTADELISYIGLLRDFDLDQTTKDFLLSIQENLMVASSILAVGNIEIIDDLPKLSKTSIVQLENEIDRLEEILPTLKAFLIPGGHPAVSTCHICRTICRRTERRVYDILDEQEEELPEEVAIYFNRLSDYLFVLSRALSKYFKVIEIIWRSNLD